MEYFTKYLFYHDKTDPVLPDGPHVAGGGGDAEEEGDGEQGGAQAAHQAGAEVGGDRLLGRHGHSQPWLLQDVEQEVQAVAGHRHHQHGDHEEETGEELE